MVRQLTEEVGSLNCAIPVLVVERHPRCQRGHLLHERISKNLFGRRCKVKVNDFSRHQFGN